MRKRTALPGLFTVCNLLCGLLSIVYASQGRLVPAAWLIVIAGFLDAFDGKIARLIDASSRFGVHFDSLADVCSFGVAPAVLMFSYYTDVLDARWLPFAICFFFLLCGACRLARFNTRQEDLEKRDFIGLPIPPAAATLAAYIVFTQRVWQSTHEPQVAVALCVMISLLMISPFDYPAFPKLSFETHKDRLGLILALSAVVLISLFTDEAFFPIALCFALSGAVRWLFNLIIHREVPDIGS